MRSPTKQTFGQVSSLSGSEKGALYPSVQNNPGRGVQKIPADVLEGRKDLPCISRLAAALRGMLVAVEDSWYTWSRLN